MKFHDYAEPQSTAALRAPIVRVTEPASGGLETCVSPSDVRCEAVSGALEGPRGIDPAWLQPVPRSDGMNLAFGSRAEFRSRLSWFIGVSDAGPQDPGSLTYERYFGLREKPFSLSSDPRFFFSNSAHGAAFDRLAAGIRRREGILVLSGEVGTGKTTLCQAVFQSLDQKTFAAFVPDPFLSREDLLKTLLVNFGVVSVDEIRKGRLRGVSRTDLSYPLYDFLASLQALKAFAVVMIDEAQNLTAELLEEIRILSDLENRQKLLQILLVGQPELQLRLTTSAMRQLSQRVSIRCELIPLTREDVRPYVSHRLTIAGNDGRVQFTDAAIDLVGTASNGTPRVINLVCDRALLRAAHSQTLRVDAEHVVWAVDDLGLPVAQTVRVPFGDQPGGGLESFREEFLEPSLLAFSSAGLGSQLDETRVSALPEAEAPKQAIVGDFAAARRRRNSLLMLVGGCLALATSLVGWYSSAPAGSPNPPSTRTDTKLSPGQTAARAERDLDRARQMPGYDGGRVVQLGPSLRPPTLQP